MKKTFPLFLCCLILALFSSSVSADDWKIVEGKIVSKFAKDVDPKNPLPEYPRPQMVRKTWLNLNGLWDYAIRPRDAEESDSFDGKILVPFPVESALSGVGKPVGADKKLCYRKSFTVPKGADWDARRVLLHFGAVDWETTVFVNGKEVGKHSGGYSPFSFDITDALNPEGEQTLFVSVWDPTTDGPQPIGKQHNKPRGIWYTPVTGIWQTVWLEPVPESRIERIKLTPNIKDNTLTIETTITGARKGDQVEAKAIFKTTGTKQVPKNIGPFGRRGSKTVKHTLVEKVAPKAAWVGRPLVLDVSNAKRWTPETPNLYELNVYLVDAAGRVVDAVDSYFAMRESSLGSCERGFTRMMLNGEFVFQHGPLDQGWWPDGLYTAPTDEALAYDIVVTKQLGYNMLRKHVKVEPARFYYHCDRLGILVWQDMPSGDPKHYIRPDAEKDADRSPESKAIFEKELTEMIETLYNHPSIVVWVPFNEGWGQFDTSRILELTGKLDPTRLVDGPSGWADRGCGDMYDMHKYRGPGMFPPEEKRATVLGEYGGLGLPVKGHLWVESDKNWGYGGSLKDQDDLLKTYMELNARLHPLIGKGLSAAVYTQTTDVEVEVNGLMTYDREIIKVDVEKFKASNDALRLPPPELKTVLPTAREQEAEWSYTTDKPGDAWEKADFDDASWKKGKAGFGQGAPNATNRTEWKTNDIWIRRSFELSEEDVKDPSQLRLDLFHDEDAEVYVNGVKVLEVKGFSTDYASLPMTDAAKAFKVGRNVLAIHCTQTGGGQYVDAGLSRVIQPKGEPKRIW